MTDWNKLKVTDLRAELKRRGLPQAGLKPALVARLAAAENDDGSESEATIQGDTGKLDASSAAATSPDTVSPVLPPSADSLPAPSQTTAEAAQSSSQTAAEGNTVRHSPEIETQSFSESTQPAATVESSQPPEPRDDHKSALPSVDPSEANDDRQKRKRRSQSPAPSATDAARKRFRADDEDVRPQDEVAAPKDDEGLDEMQDAVDAREVKSGEETITEDVGPAREVIDAAIEDVKEDGVPGSSAEVEDEKMEVDKTSKLDREGASAGSHEDSPSRPRDSRFKNLFPETTPQTTGAAMGDAPPDFYEEGEPDRIISPAIHAATSALYIRDFMRPLSHPQLKAHLAALAAPPGRDTDPDVITSFYIDPIRTHAFVSFTNVSAAARVRSALHDRIWPDEKTRKPLWVDFIPVEKVEEWVEQEQEGNVPGGRSMGKKWEVYYDVDEDRHVTAILQEAGNVSRPAQQTRKPSIHASSPQGPQSSQNIESAPTAPRLQIRGQATISTGRGRLDELFNSTLATPVLYWQPVSKSVANKRLDNIDAAMSKDAAAGRPVHGGDINRYTFEDSDILVDRGPEIFPGIRPPPGFRGPRGGSRGGFQSRGAYGGGGGGGGRYGGGEFGGGFGGRAPDRQYDSYRGGHRGDHRGDNRGDVRSDRRSSRDYGGRY